MQTQILHSHVATVLIFEYTPPVKKVDRPIFLITSTNIGQILPRDASAERGYEIACRPSVRLSVCLSVRDDQVS